METKDIDPGKSALIELKFGTQDSTASEEGLPANPTIFGNQIQYTDAQIQRWLEAESMTSEALLDSVQATRKSTFDLKMAEQALRIFKDSGRELQAQIMSNIPTMLFVFLPVLAGFFKILYIRRNVRYMEHFILTFHYHTFIFLVSGIAMLLPNFYLSEILVSILVF